RRRSCAATSTPRAGRGSSTACWCVISQAKRGSPSATSRRTARPSTTCACGTATRCSRHSGSSRRSAPTTTSCRWTTTATSSTANWVVANTGQQEFDYPSGDENIFGTYKGNGGVVVGGLLRRLVLAAYFRSLKVLLSSDITAQSRALYIRNIRQRAHTALPFL